MKKALLPTLLLLAAPLAAQPPVPGNWLLYADTAASDMTHQACQPYQAYPDCVFEWENLSPVESGMFGQDDSESCPVVPSCLSGLPCVEGDDNMIAQGASQNCSLETQYVVDNIPAGQDYSMVFLLRRGPQTGSAAVTGRSHNRTLFRPSDGALRIKSSSPIRQTVISKPGTVDSEWHLYEIHRAANVVTVIRDGEDWSALPGGIAHSGQIGYRNWFSCFKGVSWCMPFDGRMALLGVTQPALTQAERDSLRGYVASTFGVGSRTPPPPSGDPTGASWWWRCRW